LKFSLKSEKYMCLELAGSGSACPGYQSWSESCKIMGIWPYPDLVILDRICKNMIILPPQRKSLGASSFLYSIKCNLKYVYCSSGQNRQVIIYANLIYLYWFIRGVDIIIGVCRVAIF
jgi:hypothetical protein